MAEKGISFSGFQHDVPHPNPVGKRELPTGWTVQNSRHAMLTGRVVPQMAGGI